MQVFETWATVHICLSPCCVMSTFLIPLCVYLCLTKQKLLLYWDISWFYQRLIWVMLKQTPWLYSRERIPPPSNSLVNCNFHNEYMLAISAPLLEIPQCKLNFQCAMFYHFPCIIAFPFFWIYFVDIGISLKDYCFLTYYNGHLQNYLFVSFINVIWSFDNAT
jgi:hypothetical protein